MPSVVLYAFCVLTLFNPLKILWGEHYNYYPILQSKKLKHKEVVACPSSHS